MATRILGREIVANIFAEGTLQPFLNMGWDLDWLADSLNPEFAAVFQGQDVDAYRYILTHHKKFGVVPDFDIFRKSFPKESYQLDPGKSLSTPEIIAMAVESVNAYVMEVAVARASAYLEAGQFDKIPSILDSASARVRAYLAGDNGLTIISLGGMTPRQTEWLWDERLPLGALSLTAGAAGIGKSQFAAWLTAQVTNGTLPGDLIGTKSNVLYVYIEDSLEQTLLPRMMAAGADLDRVAILRATGDLDHNFMPNIEQDLDKIEALITRHDIALVVFDPLVSAMQADRNKATEVRKVLQKVSAMSERTGVAVHGLMHLRKQSADNMLTMIGGSGDFGAIARAVLGFAASEDPDDPHTVVSQLKNNLGRTNLDSLRFTIESAEVGEGMSKISTSRLVWEGVSEWSANDVMSHKDTAEARTKTDQAIEWLSELLQDGPREKSEILAIDKADNGRDAFGDVMLKRAAKKMGLVQKRMGYGKGSEWSLPVSERNAA